MSLVGAVIGLLLFFFSNTCASKVEREVWGDGKRSVARLLAARILVTTAPSTQALTVRKVKKHRLKDAAAPRMRRLSAHNIFVQEEECIKAKVGSQEHLDHQLASSKNWETIKNNPNEMARLTAKASEQQELRSKLAVNPVSAKVATVRSGLRLSQVKRLGQLRLDNTVLTAHRHPAWDSGLALGDQNSALKEKYIVDDSHDKCSEHLNSSFDYDMEVIHNPKSMPQLHQVCSEKFGGTCQSHPLHDVIELCVQELDRHLASFKLKTAGTLLKIGPPGDASGARPPSSSASSSWQPPPAVEPEWYVLGSVSCKPLLHVLVGLKEHEGKFQFAIWTGPLPIEFSPHHEDTPNSDDW